MRNIPWLKIGAVGALWVIVVGAGAAGWMIGRDDAAREYSELQRRINAGSPAACGIEVELLDAQGRGIVLPSPRRASGPVQIFAPSSFLNLREMLATR